MFMAVEFIIAKTITNPGVPQWVRKQSVLPPAHGTLFGSKEEWTTDAGSDLGQS